VYAEAVDEYCSPDIGVLPTGELFAAAFAERQRDLPRHQTPPPGA